MKTINLWLSALILLIAHSAALAVDEAALEKALNGDHRPAADKARDQYRHPAETLAFFGIEKDDTVVESWPGGGWYTQVLAPYLKDEGQLIVAEPRPNPRYHSMLEENSDVYGEVVKVDLAAGEAMAEPGTVDAILDFRNAHNWIGSSERREPLLKAWHAALKSDGIVGIVDHRQDADSSVTGRTGYVTEQQVIDVMEEHGFELLERSEVNANPKDTKDHPSGVWTLPPSLRLGDQDRDKYLAIGESDRMTLKFRKK
ncbi:MAG: methyltransferase [Cellvibrionaceae bacterium]